MVYSRHPGQWEAGKIERAKEWGGDGGRGLGVVWKEGVQLENDLGINVLVAELEPAGAPGGNVPAHRERTDE